MCCIVFTLTFDSSPIKGEGEDGWCCLCSASDPSVRHWDRLFDPLPSRERGGGGWCWLVHPRHPPPLWIADQVRNDVLSCPVVPRPVVSRLRGNDGPRIYRIGTMCCIVFTLTLVLSHQGRGGNAVGVVLLSPPCGFPPTRE